MRQNASRLAVCPRAHTTPLKTSARAHTWRVPLWAWVGLLSLLAALPAPAQLLKNVSLAWDPVDGVAGYKLYYGVSSRQYTNSVVAGSVPAVTVSNLTAGVTYYFAVTAIDYAGGESDYSSEITSTIPFPPAQLSLGPGVAGSLWLTGVGQPGHCYEVIATRQFTAWQAIGRVKPNADGSFIFPVPFSRSDSGRYFQLHDLTGIALSSLPSLSSTLLPDRRVQISLTGVVGHSYDLEASTDYGPWKPIGAIVLGSGNSAVFIVPVELQYHVRFFRLRDTTYTTSNWPATLSLSLTPARQAILSGVGTVGSTYAVLSSDDMSHWTSIGSVTIPATGNFQFTDPRPVTSEGVRIYKLRQVDP